MCAQTRNSASSMGTFGNFHFVYATIAMIAAWVGSCMGFDRYRSFFYLINPAEHGLEEVDGELLRRIQVLAEQHGITRIGLTAAFRTWDEQNALFLHPDYTAARPGNSWHEYGAAVDIPQNYRGNMFNGNYSSFGIIRPGRPFHIQLDIHPRDYTTPAQGRAHYQMLANEGRVAGNATFPN